MMAAARWISETKRSMETSLSSLMREHTDTARPREHRVRRAAGQARCDSLI